MGFNVIVEALLVSVTLNIFLLIIGVKMAADFTALNTAIAKLQTDVAALIAAGQPNVQPAIDAATAAVNAIDNTVVAATPVTPPTA